MPDSPLFWSVAELVGAYRSGQVGPVEVTEEALRRIERYDGEVHAYLSVLTDQAREQARDAAWAYRRGEEAPLLGVPVAVKDVFHVAGAVTTCGSELLTDHVATHDSGVVRRLRAAGAVLLGKTNTPEFCQSATTDNRLGPDTANPWDPTRTAGGSSGGSAAAVASGLATVAVGSDGGGSIRIPAAFTGLVGVKPTLGRCADEHGFRTMSDFASPGSLTRTVADARTVVGVLADRVVERARHDGLRVGWCARPGGAPADAEVAACVAQAVRRFDDLGHHVEEVDVPVDGWQRIFAPLVLAEEHRERGHLLDLVPERLTGYERRTLVAGRDLDPAEVSAALSGLPVFRARIAETFASVDVLACPAVAVPAFPLGDRPRSVGGQCVSRLWGAFPYTSPFNVAGTPALTVPCGLVGGLPVGIQLVGASGRDAMLLDVAEELEEALAFDRTAMTTRWQRMVLREPA
ncbi:MAG: amidase [Streptosporangiales bacterium]|nr:amidase [Streptosporangiales bacterium]